MKKLILTVVFTMLAVVAASAQETMMEKVGNAVESGAKRTVSGAKAVYRGGKRVGYTVGGKTWTGTKWVGEKSWSGGKWVARKTVNGTKWVYYKARGTVKRRP